MSSVETQKKPSVEELLVSIRQAIHGSGPSPVPSPVTTAAKGHSRTSPVSGSMSHTRVTLHANKGKKNGFTRQHSENFFKLRDQLEELGADAPHSGRPDTSANGFAGIMNGDVRLEEALEKLKRAGLSDDQQQPDGTIRTSQMDHEEAEYTIEGADDQQNDQQQEYQDLDQFAETEETGGFSPQTRQAYIEPPHAELQPVDYPAGQTLAPLEKPKPASTTAPLTSEAITAETSAAFNRLADTIVGHATTGERSIDEITRELLRPMLQSWLDENLPRVVERLVREEIERVARWGGK